MSYEDFARDGTKTRRKQLRRSIRMGLGSSTDPAPNVETALDAAFFLDRMLADASGGRFRLLVQDHSPMAAQHVLKTPDQAQEAMREAYEARFVTSAEPAPGWVIRGRYADGTFRLFRREHDGRQTFAGQFRDYDSAADRARGGTAA